MKTGERGRLFKSRPQKDGEEFQRTKTNRGKEFHGDALSPSFPSLLCFSVTRGIREEKDRQARGRRGRVGNQMKRKGRKDGRHGGEHSQSHSELGGSTKERGAQARHPLLTVNSHTKPGGTPTGPKVQMLFTDMQWEFYGARWQKHAENHQKHQLIAKPSSQPATESRALALCSGGTRASLQPRWTGLKGRERGLVMPTVGKGNGLNSKQICCLREKINQ